MQPCHDRRERGQAGETKPALPTAQEESKGTLLLPLLGKGSIPKAATHIYGQMNTSENDDLKTTCRYTHTQYIYT